MENYKTEDLNVRTIPPAEPLDPSTGLPTAAPTSQMTPLPSGSQHWFSRHGSALVVGALMGTAFASFFIGLEAHRASHNPEAPLPASIPPILRDESAAA